MPTYRGGFTRVGGTINSPDFLYYNADIVNNNQIDQNAQGLALIDPQVRFNETRDKPILDNIEDYHFSIIRFSMNGANLDLPLFCPQVALTSLSYLVAKVASTTTGLYSAGQNYPQYSGTQAYLVGDYVLYPTDALVYKCILASTGNAPSSATYWTVVAPDGVIYDPSNQIIPTVYSFNLSYQQKFNITGGTTIITVNSGEQFMPWIPQYNNRAVAPPPLLGPVYSQNLNSRWWWATDYSYVVNLMNTTLITAWIQVWLNFNVAWAVQAPSDATPFATFESFCNAVGVPPRLVWNAVNTETHTISLYLDSSCFGQRLETFTAGSAVGTPTNNPYCRVFMNNNMYGLLSGFPTLYWNSSVIPVPLTTQAVPGTPTAPYPSLGTGTPASNGPMDGCVFEVFISNAFYTNVQDYRLTPYGGTPPLGYVPTGVAAYPGDATINYQKVYWALAQDFACVDTMWTPISSLVFTSQLMPIVKETQSDPTFIGASNVGNSTVTSPSAFQPIITDVELNLADHGADAYRGFIQYQPTAEYRLSDVAGQGPLRSLDVQLWWKARLDGELYAINMFNLSSVNIKMLFRKKRVADVAANKL